MKFYRRIHISILVVLLVLSLLASPAQAALTDEVRELIKNRYVEEVSEDTLQAATVEEMLENLNDPYTSYFTAEQYQKFLNSIGDTSFSGLGVYIEKAKDGILILKVLPNSPAEKAALKPGDIITAVDGESLAGMAAEEAATLIRGPEGSKIDLTVKRGNAIFSVSTFRGTVVIPSLEGELLPGNIGYIDINSFGLETPVEFWLAFTSLEAKGAESYIVDLRNNGGGYLSSALDIAGYFIGNKTALNAERRGEKRSFPALQHKYTVDKPLILLVNEYSASASEILAAALKDHKKALIVGNTTFGKGTVQSLYSLPSGEGYLKLTTARFFSPRNHPIDGVGISPDLVISSSDSLKASQLLLGYTEYGEESSPLTLRIGRFAYTVDTRMAVAPDFWAAYREIISGLPEYTLYKIGEKSAWQAASPQQLEEMWPSSRPADFL